MGLFDDLPKANAASSAPAPSGGLFADLPQQPGIAEDVAKSAGIGVVKGTTGLAGMIPDTMNTLDQLWQWAVSKGAEKVGLLTPEQAKEIRQPIAGFENQPTRMGLPTSQAINRTVQDTIGTDYYEPRTAYGSMAQTVGEFAPGVAAFGTGGVGSRAVQTLIPAATSEAGGALAKKYAPEYEGAARAVGGVVGGVGTAIAQTPRGARAVMQEGLQGFSDAEITGAQRLIQDAQQMGVRLTFDEALNQVTGGRASRLSQLNRVATNSGGEGGQIMSDLYSQRAGQVRQAGERAVDSIAPNPYPADMAAQAGKTAAEDALQALRDTRTRLTSPHYQAAAGDTVPQAEMQRVIQQIDDLIARNPSGEVTASARALRDELVNGQGAPRTNVGELDQIYGANRDAHMPTTPPLGETGTQARARRVAAQGVGELGRTLEASSQNLAAGRAVHRQATEQVVLPAEQGPLGRIANADPAAQGATQNMGRTLAGVGEGDRYHAVVQQSVRRMVRQDPRAAETLARDYVGDVFNRAIGDLKAGPDQYGGAGFRAQLVGDPASMRNVQAVITQLPQGHQRWAGFNRFLDVMEATGYKPAKGSDTAFNQAIQEQLKTQKSIAGAITETVTSGGLNIKQAISDGWARFRSGNTTEKLATMLTDPEAIPLLRQLARTPVGSARAQGLAVRLTYIAEQSGRNGSPNEITVTPAPRQ